MLQSVRLKYLAQPKTMKFILIGLIVFLNACMPRYNNVPVEDISAEEIETIDLDTADVKIDEDLSVDKGLSPGMEPVSNANTGSYTKPVGSSDTEMVKPLEVAAVDSKPANTLLIEANAAISSGNYAKAEVLLERALRISPRNPKLWYKMSQVKYAKGDYPQSAAMAMRSNTMTSDSAMKKQNWRIIANSREKLGDLAGAEQARRYAAE